jgi:hypothetical protein
MYGTERGWMDYFDLGLAWNWEHDADFVELLQASCRQRGVSLLQITPANLGAMLNRLEHDHLTLTSFFDRASEDDSRFMPVVEWARTRCVFRINPYEQAHRSWDKASMHARVSKTMLTPLTIVLPPYGKRAKLSAKLDLTSLGPCFTIKPAHGSGGQGVIHVATSLADVESARQEFPDDKYLLQARVVPVQLAGQSAWFRVIYAAGEVLPCWWRTDTHVYAPVTKAEMEAYRLEPLYDMARTIARVSRLDLFSTEIALVEEHRFLVVDYANDTIDLRLQSRTTEGVPDAIVQQVADSVAGLAARRGRRSRGPRTCLGMRPPGTARVA